MSKGSSSLVFGASESSAVTGRIHYDSHNSSSIVFSDEKPAAGAVIVNAAKTQTSRNQSSQMSAVFSSQSDKPLVKKAVVSPTGMSKEAAQEMIKNNFSDREVAAAYRRLHETSSIFDQNSTVAPIVPSKRRYNNRNSSGIFDLN